jgi:Uma2 family endonuclease
MKLPEKPTGREPDLLFVAKTNLNRLQPNFLNGAADLVVEIISPESAGRDSQTKFQEYQTAAISEYWLINPLDNLATFYQLNDNGQYQAVDLDAEGKYFSRIISGFWLRPAWLWQEPLPDVEDAMLEIDGENYARQQMERFRKRGLLPQ